MTISYHPKYKQEAIELKEFLKKEDINLDINWVIGGDGSLFTYLDLEKPNFLISPENSVGHYASARLKNYKKRILEYTKNPESFNELYETIKVTINGDELTEKALNDVLITEGLHRLSKYTINNEQSMNSGILIYTPQGWHGYAKNLKAKQYPTSLGLTIIAPVKGVENTSFKELIIKINKRNRKTNFKLYIDCKDIQPYDNSCSDKEKVYHKPHKLELGDKIKISKGKEIIIVQI